MKVVTVAQMRAIEASADAAGHSYATMMEQAGRAVAEVVQARMDIRGRRILVLVGPGNNGGDGLVAARLLAQAGADVACLLARPRAPQHDENFRRLQEMRIPCALATETNNQAISRWVTNADVILDALLGTGAGLPVTGTVAQMLRAVGHALEQHRPSAPQWRSLESLPQPPASPRPLIVAVDGPSGLDFDSGALDEAALQADVTVTFAYPKRGHFRFPGAAARGELIVADIGTDPALAEGVDLEIATPEMIRTRLPHRPPDAHKGTFGRALIVAGSANYTGAARLAGAAAVRAGAGLVTIALPASIHTAVAAGLPEATYLLLPHELGAIARSAVEVLSGQMGQFEALLIGPGLGRDPETAVFLADLLTGPQQRTVGFLRQGEEPWQRSSLPPLVVDADGLNLLTKIEGWPARLPAGTVLTPHPGEMARLMGVSVADVQADRVEVARQQAREWGHVVVLKGAYTVVAAPDGRAALQPFANPGLATGGTGDVLAGTVVALRAQGLSPFDAALVGAYLHGLAGQLAVAESGAAGMAAGDLLRFLPAAWMRLEA